MELARADLEAGIHRLGIGRGTPVVVHASLSAFGWVAGGADAFVDALLSSFSVLVMPAFTYRPLVVPEAGPPGNGLIYGRGSHRNRMAELFYPDMPVDTLIGAIPESLRKRPPVRRSGHPLLSFSGVGAEKYLGRQSLQAPLAPLEALSQDGGWVLLMGVDHSSNTCLHLAERSAGWPEYTRWALTPAGIQRCVSFPGCSNGFNRLEPHLLPITRQVGIGDGRVWALPAAEMIALATRQFRENPAAYLCNRLECGRCNAARSALLARIRA